MCTHEILTNPTDCEEELLIGNYVMILAQEAVNNNDVNLIVNNIDYVAPIHGTMESMSGIDGSYTYSINASKGVEVKSTVVNTIVVEAKDYIKYPILEGDNQTPKIGENKELSFRSEGEFSKFSDLYLNDELVEKTNYTIKQGSTIVTLNTEYVKTLSLGEKVFTLKFDDGYSLVNMDVKLEETITDSQDNNNTTTDEENPKTSESSNIIFNSIFALIAIAFTGRVLYKKKSIK